MLVFFSTGDNKEYLQCTSQKKWPNRARTETVKNTTFRKLISIIISENEYELPEMTGSEYRWHHSASGLVDCHLVLFHLVTLITSAYFWLKQQFTKKQIISDKTYKSITTFMKMLFSHKSQKLNIRMTNAGMIQCWLTMLGCYPLQLTQASQTDRLSIHPKQWVRRVITNSS